MPFPFSILRTPDRTGPSASPSDPRQGASEAGVGEVDLLISRVVDGEASRADWVLLEAAALQDAGVWRRVALAQRDHELLMMSVRHAGNVAERVALPEVLSEAGPALVPSAGRDVDGEHDVAGRVGGGERVGLRGSWQSWGGWAVAAGLLVALSALRGTTGMPGTTPSQQAGLMPSPFAGGSSLRDGGDASSALAAYMERGQRDGSVLGEVPQKLLVRAQPLPEGGFDVVYVRQIVERTRVPDLFRFSTDEAGNLYPIRVPAQATGAGGAGRDGAAGTRLPDPL